MNLKEYMENLITVDDGRYIKSKTIKEIAKATRTTRSTVYRWISGSITPPLLKKEIISELLGKDVDILFPEIQRK